MRLLNTDFFTPRNFLVIAAIAMAWHIMLAPVFKAISGPKGDSNNG